MSLQDLYDGQAGFPRPWPDARSGRIPPAWAGGGRLGSETTEPARPDLSRSDLSHSDLSHSGAIAGLGCGWGPDLITLLAMGMAHRRPVRVADMVTALEALDLPALPCADVMWTLLQALVREGGLHLTERDTLTPGPQAPRLLLRAFAAPLDGPGGVLRAMVRVRMAFLDLLAPADRVRVLERSLLALEVAAEGVSGAFEEAWSGPWGNRWILRDLAATADDIQQVRALLDEARATLPLRPDGRDGSVSGLLYAAE